MKRFVVFASLFLVSLHFEAVSADLTPVERHGWLAVDGNRLVNQYGEAVQLRGMSYFWSMAGEARDYYNANVVNWLADDWKVNVVRAAMAVTNNWNPTSQGYLYGNKSGDKTNEQRAMDVVDAAIAKGIYAIIDWHLEAPNTDTEAATKFFEDMARKYKDVPNVIYEIFNEPTGNAATWASTVKPYSQTLVNAIRAIDPKNIIIIGTPSWCQEIAVATADPVSGSNLVYSQHFYAASHKASHRTKTETALNTNNKPVFVSEFGVCSANGDGTINLEETTTWLDFLDENKISWVNWSISKKNEAASALDTTASTSGNWSGSDLRISGAYIRNRLRAAHEREANTSAALSTERLVPQSKPDGKTAVIAPINILSYGFYAGPNPVSRQKPNVVNFYWQGRGIKSGELGIYDVVGNRINKAVLSDKFTGDTAKRLVGSWGLTDTKGVSSAPGSYLVKGAVVTDDGRKVKVSVIVMVK